MARRSKKKVESLSDIDDNEIKSYIQTDAQVCFKKLIWELINRDYLDEQAAKRSLPPKQKLPRDKKRRRADAPSDPGSVPAAETSRRSSKVNYEALDSFFRDLDQSVAGKQRRIEPDARDAADGSDPCKGEEEEVRVAEEDAGGDEYYDEEMDFDYDEYEDAYDL